MRRVANRIQQMALKNDKKNCFKIFKVFRATVKEEEEKRFRHKISLNHSGISFKFNFIKDKTKQNKNICVYRFVNV